MIAKKLAIFVEGQTESIFTKRLLEEIAGKKSILLKETNVAHLRILENEESGSETDKKYFVLIVDCGNDEAVKSLILENRDKLISSNYDLVLGLRDIYPLSRDSLNSVLRNLRYQVPTKGIEIEICLAVMEIEAWFLQDENHYQHIDASLTVEEIVKNVGFNPATDNAELIDFPTALLKKIYQLSGKTYTKSRKHVERTVNVLDYENVYVNLPNKLEHFKIFLGHLDKFIA